MSTLEEANQKRLLSARSKWVTHVEWFKQIRDCAAHENTRRLRHILNIAAVEKLRALASLVHHFLVGDVDVPRDVERKIVASRKLNLLRATFENERDLRTLLHSDVETILPKFYRVLSVLPNIVSLFFAPATAADVTNN